MRIAYLNQLSLLTSTSSRGSFQSEISVQPPDFYAVRFKDFITQRVFRKGSEQQPVESSPSIPLKSLVSPAPPEPAAVDPQAELTAQMSTSLFPTGLDGSQEQQTAGSRALVTSRRSLVTSRQSVRFRDSVSVGGDGTDGGAGAADTHSS